MSSGQGLLGRNILVWGMGNQHGLWDVYHDGTKGMTSGVDGGAILGGKRGVHMYEHHDLRSYLRRTDNQFKHPIKFAVSGPGTLQRPCSVTIPLVLHNHFICFPRPLRDNQLQAPVHQRTQRHLYTHLTTMLPHFSHPTTRLSQ